MPTIELSSKLTELPADLVGRFVKTQIALAEGWSPDPPLLDGGDVLRLKEAGVLPTGTGLLGFMVEDDSVTPGELAGMWNALGDPFGSVKKMTEERARKCRSRIKEIPSRSDWQNIFASIKTSDWHRGENDRGWVASFDWLIRNSTTPIRLLERAAYKYKRDLFASRQEPEPELNRM